MPPRKRFSKKQIIQAAFEDAREDGLDGLSVRKVAQRLGSSVAPIYVNFENVEELHAAVVARTYEVARELLAATDTGDKFLDISVASLRFAKQYSVLFRDLVLRHNPYTSTQQAKTDRELVRLMASDPKLAGFTDDQLMTILFKMKIFQLGLSVMVANDALPDEFDDETAQIQLLGEVGAEIVLATSMSKREACQRQGKRD